MCELKGKTKRTHLLSLVSGLNIGMGVFPISLRAFITLAIKCFRIMQIKLIICKEYMNDMIHNGDQNIPAKTTDKLF